MDPWTWGTPLWTLLHSAAAAAPSRRHDSIGKLIVSFGGALPCCKCRSSVRMLWKSQQGIALQDDFERVWMLHNAVNRKLGKPELPFDNAQRIWSTRCAAPTDLLTALLCTACHYRKCTRSDKQVCYEAMWRHTAELCRVVPSLAPLAKPLSNAASRGTDQLAEHTNNLRNEYLRRDGIPTTTLREARMSFRKRAR